MKDGTHIQDRKGIEDHDGEHRGLCTVLWGELCSDEKDYEAARQRLAEREKADMKPCYEDVLAEILESGGKLTVYDREDDKDHELTLEKLLNGWKKYAEDHNADDFDEYDGISADCIMQYAIFGDVIYG